MILPSTILNNTNLIRIKIVKEEWGGGGGRGEGGGGEEEEHENCSLANTLWELKLYLMMLKIQLNSGMPHSKSVFHGSCFIECFICDNRI